MNPPPPPPPPPNPLQPTLTSLNHLLTLSNHLLPITPPPPTLNTNLIQCPFNPHHLIPPPSLFLHHLRCPSSPRPLPNLDNLLHSLSYPKTLHNPLSPHLSSYFDFTTNFFYRDSPGVVTFSQADLVAKTATFNLPDFLSLECADTNLNNSQTISTPTRASILPSEYYAIARELESWNQFPTTYSDAVLRAISGIGIANESDLVSWIVTNSPRYGVVIDTHMQQHIFLLFSLCFKSILREPSVAFESSVLSRAFAWLESQVSILYGANGKWFVLNFVKKCILVGASILLLFPLGDEVTEGVTSKQESRSLEEKNANCIRDRKILMPQVVAAAAALHERSLLERQIKGFWFSQPSNNYQLVAEHCFMSEKANQEREKRVDYRPIIDYDWFQRQKLSHQETHKEKTREELLAEERDYKRRRMSYRGKKKNHSTLQVMRDLIEEYMEEIKQAGGVKSPVSVSENSGMFPPKLPSGFNISIEANNSREVSHETPAVTIRNPDDHEQQSCTDYSDKSKSIHDGVFRDYEKDKQRHHRSHCAEDKRTPDPENRRSRASTSPERQRRHSRSHERRIHHKKPDFPNRDKYNNSSRTRDKWRSDAHKNHNSDSSPRNAFSDRYDPSESPNIRKDGISSDDKYIKPDKIYDKELE